MTECPMKNELHWHVKPCKHGVWPQMFCKNCNGVYESEIKSELAQSADTNGGKHEYREN